MARMTLGYSELYTRVSNYLGLTASGTAPTGQNLTDCEAIVNRGIRQFLYPIDMKNGTPHYWSFINQYWTFKVEASKWKYALPVDFAEVLEDFVCGSDDGLMPLQKRDGQQIMKYRSVSDTTGWPEYYAIVPSRYNPDTGTIYELWIYPTPSQVYALSTFYRVDPIKLAATTDLVIGGISAVEAILESCLAVAEHQEEDNTSTHHQQKAQELIQTLIRFDCGKISTNRIGNLYQDKINEFDEDNLLVRDINTTRDIYADDR
jgi:hypothetical protein